MITNKNDEFIIIFDEDLTIYLTISDVIILLRRPFKENKQGKGRASQPSL